MKLTQDYTEDIADHFRWAHLALAIFAIVVLGRLFFLQVVRGGEYRRFSQNYSIRDVTVAPPRGLILDRNGRVLAGNQPALDLVVIPQYVMDWPRLRASVVQLLSVTPETLDAAWERRKGRPVYQPIPLLTGLSLDAVSRIKVQKTPWHFPEDPFDLRGVEIVTRAARHYSDGALAPHLLGYLQESDSGELRGSGGIEERYDPMLQGAAGRREYVVNALGRVVDHPVIAARLEKHEPVSGATLQTTIDLRLHEAAHKAFGDRAGALVALDPRSGEVLALYSSPSFDLVQLSAIGRSSYWQELRENARHPLYNRAVQGTYPPGSTYKMITALAGLSEGLVQPEEVIPCNGFIAIGGRRFGCWNKSGHGPVSLVRALAVSCDVYFYTIGLRLGLDRLAQTARNLGLGGPSGIDIPRERGGLIPTSEWKQRRTGRDATSGDVASAAIGQGYVTLTPLQDALMVARLVNGGRAITPHVVKPTSPLPMGEGQGEGEVKVGSPSPQPSPEGEGVTLIRRGMEAVVNSPGGTARALAALNLKIAGKTGTAQTVGYDSKVQKGDHAWFVGYAPYDDPKIVVAAIVEHAGHGGSVAAPIVGAVIKTYFSPSPSGEGRGEGEFNASTR